MKTRILSCLLALVLLSGCSALLDRPYTVVNPHPEHPATGEDPSTIKVSSYPELVNGVLYLVSQVLEEGSIHLVDYDGDVETDLNAACLEVAKDDPLGAYAVDFIKNDYTRILTTYEANIYITYRRTPEQIRSLVNVTGSTAIRQVLGEALAGFQSEVALRVGYFTEDEESIRALVRQAYYDTPAAALGMPEFTVSLYPGQGRVRIVEITLRYDADGETLRRRSQELTQAARTLAAPLLGRPYGREADLEELLTLLPGALPYAPVRPDGTPANTAWDALEGQGADSEGTALAFLLLCDLLDLECSVTQGTLDGVPHFWNQVVNGKGESFHVDLTRQEDPALFSGEDFLALGYLWDVEDPPSQGADTAGQGAGPDPIPPESGESESVEYEFP